MELGTLPRHGYAIYPLSTDKIAAASPANSLGAPTDSSTSTSEEPLSPSDAPSPFENVSPADDSTVRHQWESASPMVQALRQQAPTRHSPEEAHVALCINPLPAAVHRLRHHPRPKQTLALETRRLRKETWCTVRERKMRSFGVFMVFRADNLTRHFTIVYKIDCGRTVDV